MLSTYKLLYELSALYINNSFSIPVELTTDVAGDTGYSNALVKIDVTGPVDSNPVVTATDGFYTPPEGFDLSSTYDSVVPFTIQFDKTGQYTVSIKLVNVTDNSVITELVKTAYVDSTQDIANARALVEKAELTKTQSDVNDAQTIVDSLTDSTEKTDFANRLTNIQNYLTAKNAVDNAQSNQTIDNVNTAQILVNALPDSDDKTALLDTLYSIRKSIVENAVKQAETTKLQSDIDAAQSLISSFPDGQDKISFQNRINVVIAYNNIKQEAQTTIDAYELAMQSFSAGDINQFKLAYADLDAKRAAAYTAFNELPDGQDKIDFQNRYYIAENNQYAAYKMMLLGFVGSNELQPVKIENIGGTEPYKVTFKGILPGQATDAYLFYPDGYLRTLNNNILYPNDMPESIISNIAAGSDNITISNQYIQGGQFLIVFEVNDNWYKFVYEIDNTGKIITSIEQQNVTNISNIGDVWTVSRQSLIDEITNSQTTMGMYPVGFNINQVSQTVHDVFNTAINKAITIRDSVDLLTVTEVNTAVTELQTAKATFLASINTVNKQILHDLIEQTNNLLLDTPIGDQTGQISQAYADELNAVVTSAIATFDNNASTQEQIDNESTTLSTAIDLFNSRIITAKSNAEAKMAAYEAAALDFFNQVLAKKKI